jgi:hypothetical protein
MDDNDVLHGLMPLARKGELSCEEKNTFNNELLALCQRHGYQFFVFLSLKDRERVVFSDGSTESWAALAETMQRRIMRVFQ